MGIKSLFQKRVEKQITPQLEEELGNKSLAYLSRLARASIRLVGQEVVRKRTIKNIEADFRRILKEKPYGSAEELMRDDLVQEALNTPDYMALLKDLDMGEEHLELLAKEALDRKHEQ